MDQEELSFEEKVRLATEVLKQDMERIEKGILSGELIPMLGFCCDCDLDCVSDCDLEDMDVFSN